MNLSPEQELYAAYLDALEGLRYWKKQYEELEEWNEREKLSHEEIAESIKMKLLVPELRKRIKDLDQSNWLLMQQLRERGARVNIPFVGTIDISPVKDNDEDVISA